DKSFDPGNMPDISPGANHGTVAPTQYFLVIDGIAGDGVDTSNNVVGGFKVAAFDLPTLEPAAGSDASAFKPVSLTLASNTADGLLAALANGTTIDHVSLVGMSSSSITYSLNLSNVNISNVGVDGLESTLTLDYGRIGLVTTGANSDGSLGTPQTFGWDVADNKAAGAGPTLTNAGSSVAPTVATSYFLLVDGIGGGSTNAAHRDWFALNSFSFGTVNPTTGPGAGTPRFTDIAATTSGNTSLTELLAQEANGTHLRGVRIEGVDANGHAVYDLNLADVLIQQVDQSSRPGLSLDFNYRDISIVTRGQDDTGKLV